MVRFVSRNKYHRSRPGEHGVTLVELLVAMAVLLLVSLAMAQTAIVGIESNTRNGLRDEASRVAEEVMNEKLRNLTVDERDALIGTTPSHTYTRNFRNQDVDFTAAWTVQPLPGSSYDLVTVTVSWTWRDETLQIVTNSMME
jgi:prepilin-type N-terminal cleavage/methylation domain-containing protein